jgi:peptidoglycan hydrolase-like protein with peptidoglycan-binding domain
MRNAQTAAPEVHLDEDLVQILEGRAARAPGIPEWAWRSRDLTEPELWEISKARADARREAVRNRPRLSRARKAGASLVFAAVAAAAPAKSAAAPGSAQSSAARAWEDGRLLRVGSRGPAVAAVQRALGIRADGVFGKQTRRAVRVFQARRGLEVDGIVGPQTRAALFSATPASSRGRARDGLLRYGSRGAAVAAVQRALGIPADGVFGRQTRRAVRAFQARRGLEVDGVVGPQTRAALAGGAAVPARSSSPRPSRPASPRAVRGVDRRLWGAVALARSMGLEIISAHRPSATIASSGRRSDHSYYPSKAIDVAGSGAAMRRYARAVAGNRGIDIVIHTPVGMWQAGVGWTAIDSAATARDHVNHVHVDTF